MLAPTKPFKIIGSYMPECRFVPSHSTGSNVQGYLTVCTLIMDKNDNILIQA